MNLGLHCLTLKGGSELIFDNPVAHHYEPYEDVFVAIGRNTSRMKRRKPIYASFEFRLFGDRQTFPFD
jgi:hypothetical protein